MSLSESGWSDRRSDDGGAGGFGRLTGWRRRHGAVRAADAATAGAPYAAGWPTERRRGAGRGRVVGYDVGSWSMPHFSSWLFASTSERKSPAPQSFSSP